LALADLKRAQYYFDYLRKSQKLWKEKPDYSEVREVKEYKEEYASTKVSLNVEERDLFKSESQNRAEAVLGAAKYTERREGKRYDMFKEEFKDIFEEQIDSRK
jgi:hypothetical protein